MSINRVTLTGNLTRDPELRVTTNGTKILNIGIAVNDRRKNPQSGEWEDVPNFFDCVMFGPRGESLQRFLHKGSKVAIEGKLRYNSWTSQEGQKRSRVDVLVDDVEFMSQNYNNQNGSNYGTQSQYGQQQSYQSSAPSYGQSSQPYNAAGGYDSSAANRTPGDEAGMSQNGGYAVSTPDTTAPSIPTPPEVVDVSSEDIPF